MSASVGSGLFLIVFGLWGVFFLGRDRFGALIVFGAILLAWEGIVYLRKKFAEKDKSKPSA